MNDTIKIQISALVDGELPVSESELLLRRLSQDGEFRQVAESYFRIGRYMRREAEVPNMAQLRGRIALAIGDEQVVSKKTVVAVSNRFVRPLAGLAVAASVAVLAIFGLQQANVPPAADTTLTAYTQPAADTMLDEMFRHHDNSSAGAISSAILTELVSLEINAEGLIKVASRAKPFAPVSGGDSSAEIDLDTGQRNSQED